MPHPPIRTKVIVNRDSQPRKVKRFLKPALRILRRQGFRLSVYFTKQAGEVLPVAREAIAQGFEALLVAGGDGTTNEAINAIVGNDVVLGVLPFGGSNVVARELAVPLHPIRAAERIARRNIRLIDLGRANGRYFAMMASCGYDAYAISRTSRRIKKIISRYAYVWAGIKDFFGYRPSEITISLDQGKVVERGTFVVASNTHFYGGSHEIAPFAEVDDGFLDVLIYKGRSQVGLLRFVLSIFYRQHLRMKNVRYYRVRRVEFDSKSPTLVQVDGDLLGELPAVVEVVPKALKVFC
jgi:YegS/Rv2252/BmrU family lipid kinase